MLKMRAVADIQRMHTCQIGDTEMERKQLMERLEWMKKELAKKQRKFEKAKRAARVKAHVKQKIEELNQASEGKGISTWTVSPDQGKDFIDGNQQSAVSINPSGKENVDSSVAITDCSFDGRARLVTSVKLLGDSSVVAASCQDACPKVCFTSREETGLGGKGSVGDDHGSKQADVIQVPGVYTGIEDSLMITPSFRSTRDTDKGLASSYQQNLPPVLDKYIGLDTDADHTFTLNLHTDTSLCSKETLQAFANDAVTLHLADATVSSRMLSSAINTQTKELNETLNRGTEKCVDQQKKHSIVNGTVDNTLTQSITPAEENDTVEPASQITIKAISTPRCDKDGATLKLQDIGTAEDAASQNSQQPTTSRSSQQPTESPSAESVPAHDQFLDYTELDVIPFSQFQLTEDFLSEVTHSIPSSSQSRGRRKSFSALVQRRSPRLSSFNFDCIDKSAAHSALSCQRSSQQTNLFQMVRKEKRTKKALLLSSLFQYLIDEAKRDSSFVEFKLPEDIARLVSHSTKDAEREKQLDDETVVAKFVEQSDSDPVDIETIPETEIDPDFASQKFSHAEYEVKCAYSQMAEQHRLEDNLSEPAAVKLELVESKDRTDSKTAAQPASKEPALSVDLSQVSNSSKPYSNLCDGETDGLKKVKESTALLSSQSSSSSRSQSQTRLTKPKTHGKTAAKKMTLSLKGRHSQERGITCDAVSASDNCRGTRRSKNACGIDTPVVGLHDLQTEEGDGKSPVDSTKMPDSTIQGLPPTPKMPQQTVSADIFSSPVLFGTQSQSRSGTLIKNTTWSEVSSGDHQHTGVVDFKSKWGEDNVRPVFTPFKSKHGDQHREKDRCSWIQYAGCAESGCKDAVKGTVVGMTTTDGKMTAFILSVQTTALTLWTLDDQQEWSAEFHWYLPQISEAEGVCRIDTSSEQLAVLVWGVSGLSQSPFLMVFVYQWDTQHTKRFSLPLPSPVTPQRVFCHGCMANMVVVFGSDKVYTRGKRYTLDWCQSSVGVTLDMEETRAQLVDLCLVEELPDAVVGLAIDQRILIWNHKTGGLILTLALPDTVPALSRMFSCHSLQGYLLLHTVAVVEASRGVCLVALNPTAATGKVVRTFTAHSGNHTGWNLVVQEDVVLSVSEEGMLHMWDACSAKHLLSFDSKPGTIQTANLFRTTDSCWLVTGQRNGCLHIYSID